MASPAADMPLPPQWVMDQNLVPNLLAVFIVFTILPFIVVGLRLLSRRVARLPLWWDDYLILACLPLVIVQMCFLVQAIHNGMGRHVFALPPDQMHQMLQNYLMWTYASELYYPFIVTFIKSSILMLYIRLFRVEVLFRRFCYGLLVFVICWGIAVLFSTIFQCSPVEAAWIKVLPNGEPFGQCFSLREWLIGTNVPNILVDVVIICAPMPLIWKLKLSWPRRIALCGIFALAFATTIISILRVNANANINIEDPTWSFSPIAEFSTVEGSVGTICASLPVLAPLFRVCAGKRAVTEYGKNSSEHSGTARSIPRRGRDQQFSQLGDEEEGRLVIQGHRVDGGSGDYKVGRGYDKEQMGMPMNTINVRSDIQVASGRYR